VAPAGSLEDLQEWLRTQAGPEAWAGPSGASLRALGPRTLLVRATPATHERIAATLGQLERAWLRPLRLDLLALRVAPGQEAAPVATLAAAAEAGTGVRAGLSLLVLPGRAVTAFAGQQAAFVTDYDVEVAQRSSAHDPLVQALRAGLAVEATLWPGLRPDELRLELDAHLCELLRVEPGSAGEQRPLELPVLASTLVVAQASLRQGAWSVLPGAAARGEAAHTVLLARVREAGPWEAGAPAGHALAEPPPGSGEATLAQRSFPAHGLVRDAGWRVAPDLALRSWFEAPGAPGPLPAPAGLSGEELTSLLRTVVPAEAWGSRGGSADLRLGVLEVRAPAPTLEAVASTLGALEEVLAPAYEVQARLVDLPASSPLLADALLAPASEAALAQALAAGEATQLEHLRGQARAGQRNHVAALEERAYLQDLDLEIAQESTIVDPVVGVLATGCVVEVEPLACASPGWVRTTLALQRSVPAQALRTVRTAAGDLQCPDLRQHEAALDLALPLGRTVVAASFAAPQGRRVVLLVSVRRA
jgi:hypothetical protein